MCIRDSANGSQSGPETLLLGPQGPLTMAFEQEGMWEQALDLDLQPDLHKYMCLEDLLLSPSKPGLEQVIKLIGWLPVLNRSCVGTVLFNFAL